MHGPKIGVRGTCRAYNAGMRYFSLGISIILCVLSGDLVQAVPVERPNVLFIAVDDLRPELGCYGVEYAQSPSLDRFAESCVTFHKHFVQVPTCGASRFALLTGQSPIQSGALGNQSLYQGKTKLRAVEGLPAQTFPELFRRNGYETVCIGKISHTPDGKVFNYDGTGNGRSELPGAWDQLATPYGPWKRGWGTFFAYADGRHREDGLGHKDLMEFEVATDDALPDGMMARVAIDKLAELKSLRQTTGKPFLMGLGFFKPHLPWVATEADWQAFENVEIPPPRQPEKIKSIGFHNSGEFYKYRVPWKKTRPLALPDQLSSKRAYLACVRYVDRQIGRVLDALNELDLAEDTIVVIWGDHGWHLGETAIWGKHSPFDRSLNSVLMIRVPGVSKPGHRCDELVESTDLYPTLTEACQLEITETAFPLNGHSLIPLLEGGDQPLRSAALSMFGKGVTLRSKTHRWIGKTQDIPRVTESGNPTTPSEFYNLQITVDPVVNVIDTEPEALDEIEAEWSRKKKIQK